MMLKGHRKKTNYLYHIVSIRHFLSQFTWTEFKGKRNKNKNNIKTVIPLRKFFKNMQ